MNFESLSDSFFGGGGRFGQEDFENPLLPAQVVYKVSGALLDLVDGVAVEGGLEGAGGVEAASLYGLAKFVESHGFLLSSKTKILWKKGLFSSIK